MDVDPTVSLAFTLEANPGSYALLLGSGVSYGAVPTAWEILSTLVTRLANVSGADTEDPMAWYEATYGKAPSYSDVLESLSPSPAGRVGLLRPFFEGSPAMEERAEIDAPQPTDGHRAIARLMKAGLIKVAITTNFDRLLEQALDEVGVAPTILSTPWAMAGALPLHQQTACIIKIHGDYLDPAFLNTGDELATYDPEVRKMIGRVLDDYGLVTCGWSATWDVALRHDLAAHNSRRYTNCWVNPSELSEEAMQLIQQRDATIITKTSSAFFGELEGAIMNIRSANRTHPTSIAIGVATTKRAITSANLVDLHDLLASAFDAAELQAASFPLAGLTKPQLDELTRHIDGALSLPVALLATAARWGAANGDEQWVSRLLELGTRPTAGGNSELLNLRHYPASLALYAAGTGMVLAGRLRDLERLLRRTIPNQGTDLPGPLSSELSATRALSYLGSEREPSQHVYDVVSPILREHLRESESAIRDAFDELELMMALVGIDSQSDSSVDVRYASDGIIRRHGNFYMMGALPAVQLDAARVDGVHPWIAEGLFGGDAARLDAALQSFNSTFATRQMYPGS